MAPACLTARANVCYTSGSRFEVFGRVNARDDSLLQFSDRMCALGGSYLWLANLWVGTGPLGITTQIQNPTVLQFK
jgi:hypothetical protein